MYCHKSHSFSWNRFVIPQEQLQMDASVQKRNATIFVFAQIHLLTGARRGKLKNTVGEYSI
jgi:hypothetical protein